MEEVHWRQVEPKEDFFVEISRMKVSTLGSGHVHNGTDAFAHGFGVRLTLGKLEEFTESRGLGNVLVYEPKLLINILNTNIYIELLCCLGNHSSSSHDLQF